MKNTYSTHRIAKRGCTMGFTVILGIKFNLYSTQMPSIFLFKFYFSLPSLPLNTLFKFHLKETEYISKIFTIQVNVNRKFWSLDNKFWFQAFKHEWMRLLLLCKCNSLGLVVLQFLEIISPSILSSLMCVPMNRAPSV